MTVITITMPIEERDSELERLREGERLRAKNERLRAALERITGIPDSVTGQSEMRTVAKAALAAGGE